MHTRRAVSARREAHAHLPLRWCATAITCTRPRPTAALAHAAARPWPHGVCATQRGTGHGGGYRACCVCPTATQGFSVPSEANPRTPCHSADWSVAECGSKQAGGGCDSMWGLAVKHAAGTSQQQLARPLTGPHEPSAQRETQPQSCPRAVGTAAPWLSPCACAHKARPVEAAITATATRQRGHSRTPRALPPGRGCCVAEHSGYTTRVSPIQGKRWEPAIQHVQRRRGSKCKAVLGERRPEIYSSGLTEIYSCHARDPCV